MVKSGESVSRSSHLVSGYSLVLYPLLLIRCWGVGGDQFKLPCLQTEWLVYGTEAWPCRLHKQISKEKENSALFVHSCFSYFIFFLATRRVIDCI